ncbi:MAG TPA: hypothetical protein VHD56_10580 [Tepidisphaeraceae bacterium]|nr:hypothetical protein [Tepidisphaeraceae bacterium]
MESESTTETSSMENGGASQVSEEMKKIHASFSQLRQDVMDLLSHAFGLGRGGAEVAKEEASNAVESLKERLSDLKERGSEQVSAVEEQIGENPVRAVLVAFGVGFILAKLFSRK